MRRAPLRFLVLLAVAGAACGQKIGDPCQVSSDCSQDGSRVCDTFSPGGFCTIEGCDYGTCPDEAVCVRFFPGVENARACDAGNPCDFDEVCTVANRCAPQTVELRRCMPTCGGHGDCRPEYECRDLELMRMHGGEPVPDPAGGGEVPDTPFCAARRSCVTNADCMTGQVCDRATRVCLPG
jgi:hypothetical protein